MSQLKDLAGLTHAFLNRDSLPFSRLPTPTSILEQCQDQGASIIKFEHPNLAVKVGDLSYLRLEEV